MTKSTSHCSRTRMNSTRPAGMFASTYRRGWPAMRSACGPSSEASDPITASSLPLQIRHRFSRVGGRGALTPGDLRFLLEGRHERITLVHQFLAFAPPVLGSHRVLTEERKGNRGIAVRDDGVGKNTGVYLAPAHRFGR